MQYSLFLELFNQTYKSTKNKFISNEDKFNLLREELQKMILKELYELDEFRDIHFMWWTNLRISYWLDRFSEDLDFAIDSNQTRLTFDIEKIFDYISWIFKKRWFHISTKCTTKTTVKKWFISFWKILYDLSISPLKDETIKIKLEFDTNAPKFAGYSVSDVNLLNNENFLVKIHDKSTTFAWKIGAILLREYTKWRDYFDILWYFRTFNEQLNLNYLNDVLRQYNLSTNKEKIVIKNNIHLMELLNERFRNLKSKDYISDMNRFVLSQNKDKFLKEAENIGSILEQRNISYFTKLWLI